MKTLTILTLLFLPAFIPFGGFAQFLTVTGTVKDYFSGQTIRQLSIVEKKSGIGTITSAAGDYSLILRGGEVELNFSDANHEAFSATFYLLNDTTINVTLKPVESGAVKRSGKDQELLAGRSRTLHSEKSGRK